MRWDWILKRDSTQRDDTLSFGVTWIIGIIGGGRFVLSVSGTVNENGVARPWIIVSYGLQFVLYRRQFPINRVKSNFLIHR